MTSQAKIRAARVVIPVAVVIGVAAAFIGNWIVVASMALVVLVQVASLLERRRRPSDRDSG